MTDAKVQHVALTYSDAAAFFGSGQLPAETAAVCGLIACLVVLRSEASVRIDVRRIASEAASYISFFSPDEVATGLLALRDILEPDSCAHAMALLEARGVRLTPTA